jgi:hypothetical protein
MVLSRPAAQTRVTIDGADRSDEFHPLSIDLSTGGGRLDTATLEIVKIPRDTFEFEDEALIDFEGVGAECEISVELPDGSYQVIHWGTLAAQTIALDGGGHRRGLVSRLEPRHFGLPLWGMPCRATPKSDGAAEEDEDEDKPEKTPQTVIVPIDVVFNPEYDGRCVGNRGVTKSIKDAVFVPPEQLRFSELNRAVSGAEKKKGVEASTVDGLKVAFWDLSQAVQILCRLCNGDEPFVKNPSPKDLDTLFKGSEALLRAHKQPLGKYLPEQLDVLLRPYGFDWCVDCLSPGKRQIRVFARGQGTAGTVKLQPRGAALDMDKSNAEHLDLTADLSSRTASAFRLLGDEVQIEATFELVPAWPKSQDDSPLEDLIPPSEDEQKTDHAWLKLGVANTSRAWRDWVLNEAGDYTGERDGISETYDLATILGPCVAKRRKFEPTITLGDDGSPIGEAAGITIEWWDKDQPDAVTDSPGAWRSLKDISPEARQIKILAHECGIRFDGDTPPQEIQAQGVDEDTGLPHGKIRVTASIRADQRLEVQKSDPSPLDPVRQIETIDVGSRFKMRSIDKSSIYFKKVKGKLLESSQLDDTDDALKLVQQLLTNWNQASVAGHITTTGCGYRAAGVLGRPISGVDGRNIDFRTTHPDVETKYPVVVGLHYDFTNQTVALVLDTFRGEG